MSTDSIQKKILLKASRSRVWRALTDSSEFGYWFGMTFNGPFLAGKPIRGIMASTGVNAEVASAQSKYQGLPFDIAIETLKPESLFSFRWHPHAIEKGVDYSAEPTTLVEFVLEEVSDGVLLTVTESGFDKIPLERRAKAFSANDGGWTMVIKLIEEYLVQKP
jgi:uncharacterized protein YndB with AHSA1/START domain